jgi:hypothetical protein
MSGRTLKLLALCAPLWFFGGVGLALADHGPHAGWAFLLTPLWLICLFPGSLIGGLLFLDRHVSMLVVVPVMCIIQYFVLYGAVALFARIRRGRTRER